jgi:hypothetical protein
MPYHPTEKKPTHPTALPPNPKNPNKKNALLPKSPDHHLLVIWITIYIKNKK